MKLNNSQSLTAEQIWNIVGRKFPLGVSNDKTVTLPDDLPQSDVDKINSLLFPDEQTIKTDTVENRLTRIEKLLGLRQ